MEQPGLPPPPPWPMAATGAVILDGFVVQRPHDGAEFQVFLHRDSGELVLAQGTKEHPHTELSARDMAGIASAYRAHREGIS